MGLRAKIGIAIAATAAVVAVLIGLLVHNRTVDSQYALATESLDGRLATAVQDRAAGVDSGSALINPEDLPEPLKRVVDQGARGSYLDRGGKTPMLWVASKYEGDVVALKRPYIREEETVESLDRVLWVSGAVGTALACVVGLLVATRLGRRLTTSAVTAQRIAEGDLSARLAPGGRDEITQLTSAVNTMADALAARLQAERDVTANIAHELRTPVAGLVAAADLLPPSRPMEMVRDRAQRMRGLVEDVLEVARLDSDKEEAVTEIRPLGALVRRALAGVVPAYGEREGEREGERKGERKEARPAVELRVISDCLVETDARRVERVLVNLVNNALRHGAPPVTVEVEGGLVRVRDHGPGFPATLLAHGPQRFRTGGGEGDRGGHGGRGGGAGRGGNGGQGTGLGLTIALGQAGVLGARLTFTNPADGGAEAVLDLGRALRSCLGRGEGDSGVDGDSGGVGGEGEGEGGSTEGRGGHTGVGRDGARRDGARHDGGASV